jgi:hypothetical protein
MNCLDSSGRKASWHAAVIILAVLGVHSQSWADNLGLRGYPQTWNPTQPTATALGSPKVAPGVLSTGAVDAWNQYVGIATGQITQVISASNYLGSGFTLKNPRLQIAGVENVEMRVAPEQDPLAPAAYQTPSGNAPVIVIHSIGSRLDAGSTTPYTTSDTDPTFHVTFDLTAYVKLAIGPRATAIGLTNATVVVSNAAYTPDNATAKDAQALGPLQNFFGARSFSQQIADSLNGQSQNITGALTTAVKSANSGLGLLSPGSNFVAAGIFADAQWLNVVFAPHVQPDSNGSMNGTLTVSGLSLLPASQRSVPTNVNCTKLINLTDTVQVQPDYVGSLNPLQIQKGSGPTVSLNSRLSVVGGTIAPAQDGWSCQYSVTGLADQVANNIQFVEPGVSGNGSLPNVGYVVDVNFQGCSAGSAGPIARTSAVNCLRPGLCSDAVTPPNGSPINCNLAGIIALSSGGGVGVAKQSAFGGQAVNPVSPTVWGAANATRATTPATTPVWGTPATTSAPSGTIAAPGSALNRGSALQARPVTPAAPAAPQF